MIALAIFTKQVLFNNAGSVFIMIPLPLLWYGISFPLALVYPFSKISHLVLAADDVTVLKEVWADAGIHVVTPRTIAHKRLIIIFLFIFLYTPSL